MITVATLSALLTSLLLSLYLYQHRLSNVYVDFTIPLIRVEGVDYTLSTRSKQSFLGLHLILNNNENGRTRRYFVANSSNKGQPYRTLARFIEFTKEQVN
ncbi:hypothetical protein SAMN05660429_02272 [Thalassotalea agarivorans]|uniref:Uncharacterized protein n=2 Tax=Thalassotalea agarivorans TaxID=349064 RepID=A0A1I0FX85_THASX|nr:hypothetical protein SAMN05660429_02272 [Thalassotalea agarivorans]